LGQRDRIEETYQQAEQTARTLVAAGINLNLAPVVDLDANAANPIIKGKGRLLLRRSCGGYAARRRRRASPPRSRCPNLPEAFSRTRQRRG
jgi:hypothetical protein